VPDHLNLNGTDFLAHQRVGDLQSTAHEVHGLPKTRADHAPGTRIHRVRTSIGRRLISLGSAVAGHQE
jgi:hypothetical protein